MFNINFEHNVETFNELTGFGVVGMELFQWKILRIVGASSEHTVLAKQNLPIFVS